MRVSTSRCLGLAAAAALAVPALVATEALAHDRRSNPGDTHRSRSGVHRPVPATSGTRRASDGKSGGGERDRRGGARRPVHRSTKRRVAPSPVPTQTPTPMPTPVPTPAPQPAFVVQSSLLPALPTSAMIGQASPILFDMAMGSATASVSASGQIEVRLSGLVFAQSGSTTVQTASGPITIPSVSASLVCGDGIAQTTAAAPISAAGAATISARIALPGSCLSPAVLIHPVTNTTVYLAAGRSASK